MYDGGVKRPATVVHHGGNNLIEAANATTLYGSDTEISPSALHVMSIASDGVHETAAYGGFAGDYEYSEGLLYSTTGRVVDPTIPMEVANLNIWPPTAVEPDPATDRLFIAASDGIRVYSLSPTHTADHPHPSAARPIHSCDGCQWHRLRHARALVPGERWSPGFAHARSSAGTAGGRRKRWTHQLSSEEDATTRARCRSLGRGCGDFRDRRMGLENSAVAIKRLHHGTAGRAAHAPHPRQGARRGGRCAYAGA